MLTTNHFELYSINEHFVVFLFKLEVGKVENAHGMSSYRNGSCYYPQEMPDSTIAIYQINNYFKKHNYCGVRFI